MESGKLPQLFSAEWLTRASKMAALEQRLPHSEGVSQMHLSGEMSIEKIWGRIVPWRERR